METGVDAGSMVVPDVVWLSSDSMRLVGGVILPISIGVAGFIGVAGVLCGMGMLGMGDCVVCA
jgi:hypothetical protein